MKKQFKEAGLVAALVAVMAVAQVRAADMAAASGVLANVSAMAVQAKANLASAAESGNVEALAEATKRANAVDAAVADAQKAYAAMERAVSGGDPDTAASAFDDLQAAEQRASDALNGGETPDVAPRAMKDEWKESKKNTGGGPTEAYSAPNIYDVPWRSAGLRSLYDSLFGAVWDSTVSMGGSMDDGLGDTDATPE